jgi:hypothetical protein
VHAWPTTCRTVGFHDWADSNTTGGQERDTYAIGYNSYSYSGEQFNINSWSDSGTAVSAEDLLSVLYQFGSGWNITSASLQGGAPIQTINTRRIQLRIATTKGALPYRLLKIIASGTSAPGSLPNWPDTSVNERQWAKRVTVLEAGTLVMDEGGYKVIELPYPEDEPFPIVDMWGMPVLISFVAMEIDGESSPIGDMFWEYTEGVGWGETWESIS